MNLKIIKMKNNINYYITHIVPERLPDFGLKKLFFYTTTDDGDRRGLYYWGKGNKPFTKKEIENKVAEGKLIPLHPIVKLEVNKGLWLDDQGRVFNADLKKPMEDKTFLFAPKMLSRSAQIYKEVKESSGQIPRIQWIIETVFK
jgi:hypothetical protein